MSDETMICPQCSEPLTSEAPGGLCPRCVMAMNLSPDTIESDAGAIPGVEELAPHFPQLEILECLGRGGMGIVYKARQPQLDRLVALKILAPERVDDVRFAERFRREGVSLARLDHPNIVTVYDTGESGGFYYLLMEFVDGLNLREAIAGEKMPAPEALAIVPPICAGLEYAHEQGVVHRDIKPENILLDKKGRVKIADFGVAKLVCGPEDPPIGDEVETGPDPGLTMGGKLGTPQYMAPEQKEKLGASDHRADIYALGVVFYEMLTGERPTKDLVAPSRKVEVDVRIDEIVLRALEKEPAKRYQTAGEFRTMVETVANAGAKSEASSQETERIPSLPNSVTSAYNPWETSIQSEMEPRFSRLAIIGAVWAGVALFVVLFKLIASSEGGQGSLDLALTIPLVLLGLTAPLGTTICGVIAVSQIRRSAGRLCGLGMALFDSLLFPLLLLDALIIWLVFLFMGQILVWIGFNPGTEPTLEQVMLPAALVILVTNAWLARWAWCMAKPVQDRIPAAEKSASAIRTGRMTVAVSLLLLIGALALMVLIPRQTQRRIEASRMRQQEELEQHTRQVLNLGNRWQGLSEADRLKFLGSDIRHIFLQDSLITDEDMESIAKHPEVESLNLTCALHSDQPQITDAMLEHLADCRELRSLHLHGNPITDAGLEHLASLPNLERLQLGATEVTGAGLQDLAHVTWLRLDATPIDDAGLAYVGRMRSLEQLYLAMTGISDAGLAHLYGLKKLRFLSLQDTNVSAAGIAALKKAMPWVSVGIDEKVAAESSLPGEFGEIMERTLESNNSLQNCFLDAETGHVLSAPDALVASLRSKGKLHGGGPQVMAISDWARRNGVDFWLRGGDEHRLITLEAVTIQDSREFDNLQAGDVLTTSEEIAKVMRLQVERGFHMTCDFRPDNPDGNTWVFRTREGTSGVLGITPGLNGSNGMKIRFKVVTPNVMEKEEILSVEAQPKFLGAPEPENDGDAQVARTFMKAIAALDVERALGFVTQENMDQCRQAIPRNARELVKVYGKDLTRLSTFTEWHRQDSYAVARVATPIPADGTRSLFLILSDTPDGWKIVDLDDIQDPATLADKLARFLRRK